MDDAASGGPAASEPQPADVAAAPSGSQGGILDKKTLPDGTTYFTLKEHLRAGIKEEPRSSGSTAATAATAATSPQPEVPPGFARVSG